MLVETPLTPKLSLEALEVVVRSPLGDRRGQRRWCDVVGASAALGTAQITGHVLDRDIDALQECPTGEQVAVNNALMAARATNASQVGAGAAEIIQGSEANVAHAPWYKK